MEKTIPPPSQAIWPKQQTTKAKKQPPPAQPIHQPIPQPTIIYNNNNDLLAVAKLSKPLVKDFTKEALIRVKIDYWFFIII